MLRFIQLTKSGGDKFYLNPAEIIFFEPSGGNCCYIELRRGCVIVKESVDEVVECIEAVL